MSGCILDRHPSSQAFHDLLKVVGETHDRKQADYGAKDDPFRNFRGEAEYGLPDWTAVVIRNRDKQSRLATAVYDTIIHGAPRLQNEGIRDSFIDQAVLALIGHVLYDEWEGPK